MFKHNKDDAKAFIDEEYIILLCVKRMNIPVCSNKLPYK